jgi:hypothetical protein
LWGLIVALALWGIYLAIGATGIFTDVGLFDARRSAIVLACSAAFLGLWMIVLSRRRRRSTAPADRSARNRASMASLLAILCGYALWGGAWAAWLNDNPFNLTYVLGWIAVGLFALSAILAIVGLSDPLREEGQLLGLVTLVLLLLAGLGLILQIRHYTQVQARQADLSPHERRGQTIEMPPLTIVVSRRETTTLARCLRSVAD